MWMSFKSSRMPIEIISLLILLKRISIFQKKKKEKRSMEYETENKYSVGMLFVK